eukprot:c22463_g1_i1 orf=295-537(-)
MLASFVQALHRCCRDREEVHTHEAHLLRGCLSCNGNLPPFLSPFQLAIKLSFEAIHGQDCRGREKNPSCAHLMVMAMVRW